jgi:hypothetical protein
VTLEARRSPLLLLLLLLMLLGVITHKWWWWRRDRRTDAPLCVVGLGAGLLGPTCSPLALLGGSETSDPLARRSLRRLSSSDPPELPGRRHCLQPLCPCPRGWGHGGIGAGSHTGGLGTSSRCIGDPDPAEGVPAAGLANRHAAVVEGQQRGQDRRPQAWVIAERRDVLGSIRDSGTKVSPVIPHQEF